MCAFEEMWVFAGVGGRVEKLEAVVDGAILEDAM